MKKIVFINEGRLIDDEMSYLFGGATSPVTCPTTYSSGTEFCFLNFSSTVCLNEEKSCGGSYSNCSDTTFPYTSCFTNYGSSADCPSYCLKY